MLLSPVERWSLLPLPPQLKSQKSDRSATKRKNKWAEKLSGVFSKGKSKTWQTLKSMGVDKPVPNANESKPKPKARSWWKGKPVPKSKGKSKSKSGDKPCAAPPSESAPSHEMLPLPPVPAESQDPVPDACSSHPLIGKQVRTLGDKVPVSNMDRTGTVDAVKLVDGKFELAISDDKLAKFFAFEDQVVDVDSDSGKTRSAPVQLNYQRVDWTSCIFKQLPAEVFMIKHGSLLEASALSYAIAELKYRCPVENSRYFDPMEVAAVCNMTGDDEQLQLVKELTGVTKIWAAIRSHSPQHFTLLQSEYDSASGTWHHNYFDALKVPSASGMKVAQRFVDKLMLSGKVGDPVNSKYQCDGWSCGLRCMYWMEVSTRVARGEPERFPPFSSNLYSVRTNKFIAMFHKHGKPGGASGGASAGAGEVASVGASASASSSAAASGASSGEPSASTGRKLERRVSNREKPTSHEHAMKLAGECTKCRRRGCSECMQEYFIPRRILKQCGSNESQKSVGSAKSTKTAS